MLRIIGFSWLLSLVTLSAASLSTATAAEMPVEDAWKALPKYEYGNDMAALLTIDREVIRAMATPASRSACAARLAVALGSRDTTLCRKTIHLLPTSTSWNRSRGSRSDPLAGRS